jgi:hypothetical protein
MPKAMSLLSRLLLALLRTRSWRQPATRHSEFSPCDQALVFLPQPCRRQAVRISIGSPAPTTSSFRQMHQLFPRAFTGPFLIAVSWSSPAPSLMTSASSILAVGIPRCRSSSLTCTSSPGIRPSELRPESLPRVASSQPARTLTETRSCDRTARSGSCWRGREPGYRGKSGMS